MYFRPFVEKNREEKELVLCTQIVDNRNMFMYEHTSCVNNRTWSIYQTSIQLSNLLTYESEAKSPDIWKYIPKLFYSAWCQDDREGFQLSDSFNGDNFIEVVTTGDRRLSS